MDDLNKLFVGIFVSFVDANYLKKNMKKKHIQFRLLACIILAGMLSLAQSGQVYAQCTTPLAITGTPILCSATATTTLSDATIGGTWSTSDGSNVSVNATTGVVTGISGGTAIVTYTVSGGCYVIAHIFDLAITGPPTICSGGTSITMSDAIPTGTWSTTSSDISIISGTGVVNVAGGFTGPTTTATITYTPPTSTGCPDVSTTINVDLSPTVTSLTSTFPSPICEWTATGFTTAITGGVSPYTYDWWWVGTTTGTYATYSGVVGTTSTGYEMGGITSAQAGVYHTEVIDGLGCSTGDYAGPTIIITAGPYIYPLSYTTSSHIPGAQIHLSGSDLGDYYEFGVDGIPPVETWTGSGFAYDFTSTVSGYYSVTAWDPTTGCGAIMGPGLMPICPSCRTVDPQLGVSANPTIEPLSLFPNPSNGNFTVSGSTEFMLDAQTVRAEIIDITGHMVFALDVPLTNGSISKSLQLPVDITNGTYFVKIGTGGQSQMLRLSLNR